MDRQARIDAEVDACTECRGGDFPKRSDCDGCIAAVDEEIAGEMLAANAEGERIAAITAAILPGG